MTRRRGHPGRSAPLRHRGPYWLGDVVDVVEVPAACCACCGNYVNDPSCRRCGSDRRRDTGASESTVTDISYVGHQGIAKTEGAAAGGLLALLALYFATR